MIWPRVHLRHAAYEATESFGVGYRACPAARGMSRSLLFAALSAVFIGFALHGCGESEKEELDITQIFLKLDLDMDIHLNKLLLANSICLLPADIGAVPYLHNYFPGKVTGRDEDYDVTDSEMRWHIIAVNDQKKYARILDVDRSDIDLVEEKAVCSRNLVIRLTRHANRRLVAVIESKAL